MIRSRQILIPLLLLITTAMGCGLFSNKGGDAEMVFAATEVGTPEGDKVTKDIGPAGGTLTSPDGRLTLTVPQNALSETLPFGIQPITNKSEGGLGLAYRLDPNGKTFTTPLQISVNYEDHDLEGTFPEALAIAYQDQRGAWRELKLIRLDKDAKSISVAVEHFTDFDFRAKVHIQPLKATVRVGESITLELVGCDPPDLMDPFRTFVGLPVWCNFGSQGFSRRGAGNWFADVGTIDNPEHIRVSYTAPAKKPVPNIATISFPYVVSAKPSGTLNITNERGMFVAHITIVDRGYKATGTAGTTTFSGNICDLEAPFTVGTDNQFLAPFEFTPNNSAGGSWKFATKGGFVIGGGGGEYTLEGTDTLKTGIAMKGSSSAYGQGYGRRTATVSGGGDMHLTLTPLTGDECGN